MTGVPNLMAGALCHDPSQVDFRFAHAQNNSKLNYNSSFYRSEAQTFHDFKISRSTRLMLLRLDQAFRYSASL